MASVQKITGKLKTTYRVQIMRNGQRIGKSFSTKKAAELFLARITASDDLAEALTDVSLNSILFKDAVCSFLDEYQGRDQSIIRRLTWWADRLGSKPVGKITRQHVREGLLALAKDEKAPPPSIEPKHAFRASLSGSTVSMTPAITLAVK